VVRAIPIGWPGLIRKCRLRYSQHCSLTGRFGITLWTPQGAAEISLLIREVDVSREFGISTRNKEKLKLICMLLYCKKCHTFDIFLMCLKFCVFSLRFFHECLLHLTSGYLATSSTLKKLSAQSVLGGTDFDSFLSVILLMIFSVAKLQRNISGCFLFSKHYMT